ncbi:FolB domain protein [Thermanaerovibrio velox DSM 12556]|uniref:dihydroneopterin aldolase n=1 Tax=Thermanaerovibrio velox DSM 12556 TaxID=926567 RepID=H0UQZ0_9BACT|nr:dihydroneopterin aldolase [Thermanaerovibrio velox]EHM09819.1 FolB domain protein [Thermanaerovibrio velox DSM 12556]
MLTTMTIKGIHFHAFHGALEVERELGQVLEIDLSLSYDVEPKDLDSEKVPPVADASVYEIVQKVVMTTKFKAMEGLALEIARRLIKAYGVVELVTVVIRRRQLFIPGDVQSAEVEITVDREDLGE